MTNRDEQYNNSNLSGWQLAKKVNEEIGTDPNTGRNPLNMQSDIGRGDLDTCLGLTDKVNAPNLPKNIHGPLEGYQEIKHKKDITPEELMKSNISGMDIGESAKVGSYWDTHQHHHHHDK
ncbi:hypothetical protein ABK040_013723 [Willaertia magna]